MPIIPKKATLGEIMIGLMFLSCEVAIVYYLIVAAISSDDRDKKLRGAGLPAGYSTYTESPKSNVSSAAGVDVE